VSPPAHFRESAAQATLQRKAAGPARPGRAPSVVHDVLSSAGKPMDMASRGYFEPRFSHDFGRVRIHSDARAQASAAAVDARAYTVGNAIVLGKGADASAPAGRRLLAHELTHVVQQEDAAPAQGDLSVSKDAAAEAQADSVADQVEGHGALAGGTAPRRAPAMSLQRQPNGSGPDSGLKKLEKSVEDAANQAGQKIQGGGKDKLGGHIPTAPELRHVPDASKKAEPAKPVPKENLRPDPHAKAPVPPVPDKPPEATVPEKPDPGKREGQFAEGGVYQSGPNQTGMAAQGAFQDKNYVPGAVYDFFDGFKVQLGVLQPTYTLQYSHLRPTKAVAGSATQPLPPTDGVQASATISPIVITKGNLTIAPQIGVATAVGWDGSGGPRQPGSSGTHGQVLGVVNLQVDYKVDDSFSITGTVGDQAGLDASHEGAKGTNALTGSVMGTLHF
jgi:hypothetical protein